MDLNEGETIKERLERYLKPTATVEDQCPFCGFVGYKSQYHACAAVDPVREQIKLKEPWTLASEPKYACDDYSCRNCGASPSYLTALHHPHARFCSLDCIDALDERLHPGSTADPCRLVDVVRQIEIGDKVEIVQPDDEREDRFSNEAIAAAERRGYQTWVDRRGDVCGEVWIEQESLAADRQQMRQLLHARLQELGDAIMQCWEESK